MGKETISSQELSEYTHVNSTQIRRDLSGFGKFGKRGVGYNVDSLVSQIRKILRTSGQHNIALFGAGHLGRAIASSDIFADHGFRVVAIFDADRAKIGERDHGPSRVRHVDDVKAGRRGGGHRRRRPRRPDGRGAGARRPARRRRREDHLQLLRGAAAGPARGDGPHLQPRRGPPLRALLLPHLTPAQHDRPRRRARDLRGLGRLHRRHRGGVRAPRPGDARAGPAVRAAARRRPSPTRCWPSRSPAS